MGGARRVGLLLLALAGPAAAQERQTASAEQLAREQREREAERAVLDQRLRSERPDGAWAPALERSLRASLGRAKDADLRGREVRCAATLCRVILWHGSAAAQDRVLARTAGAPGFDLAGRAHLEGSGNGAVTYIYLLRPGAGWP